MNFFPITELLQCRAAVLKWTVRAEWTLMDVDLQDHWLTIDFHALKIKLTLTILLC